MSQIDRRSFLESLGLGLVVAGTGGAVAGPSWGLPLFGPDGKPLDFGPLESLASLIQETEADRLQPILIEKLAGGLSLETLVAASALANARCFGGEDYVGYHVMMALIPSLEMSQRLSGAERALPVLKVVHRNARRIQDCGGRRREKMKTIDDRQDVEGHDLPDELLGAQRDRDLDRSLALFAAAVEKDPKSAYEALQPVVRDNIDVHQVVLAWRSWDLIRIVGREHSQTLLVQALRQCVDRERNRVNKGRPLPGIRASLPKALKGHGFNGKPRPSRVSSDEDIDALAWTVFRKGRDTAMEAVAAALSDGHSVEAVGEALSLASLRLLLHDPGRSRGSGDKPKGSVHGASVGIHAADSANAWRHIARVCDTPNAIASLLAGGWHTGGQSGSCDQERPYHAPFIRDVQHLAPERLLPEIDESIRDGNQGRTAALTEVYGKKVGDPNPLLACLADHLIDQDGALHHEKFFHTCVEESAQSRAAWSWDWMTALARVAASGRGFDAPGVAEARARLS